MCTWFERCLSLLAFCQAPTPCDMPLKPSRAQAAAGPALRCRVPDSPVAVTPQPVLEALLPAEPGEPRPGTGPPAALSLLVRIRALIALGAGTLFEFPACFLLFAARRPRGLSLGVGLLFVLRQRPEVLGQVDGPPSPHPYVQSMALVTKRTTSLDVLVE